MQGKLIVFSGPSGVGKGTIRENMQFNNYVYSISSTTRSQRDGEKDGVDYNFITKEKFKNKIANGEMLEYAEFCGNFYGTDKAIVQKTLEAGKNVFLEIECQGALQVIEKMQDVISIFILPPSLEELENRLIIRNTESREVIDKRLEKASKELLLKGHYKYCIVNDQLDDVVKKLDTILEKEIYGEVK